MFASLEHFTAGESLYTKMVAPVCEKYGLTYMEFTVLMLLHNKPQYDTATQIVKIRRLSKSHVSISIRSLQEQGLLQCAYHAPDRRTIHLSLTADAAPIVKDGLIAQKQFSDVIHAGFSPEEMDLLSRFIQRIDDNIAEKTNELSKQKENIPNGK